MREDIVRCVTNLLVFIMSFLPFVPRKKRLFAREEQSELMCVFGPDCRVDG